MPEAKEAKGFYVMANEGRGTNMRRENYKNLLWSLEVVPVTHVVGSEDRPYQNLTSDMGTYCASETHYYGPLQWIERAHEYNWSYLMSKSTLGKLICAVRGKLIILAAGHHAVLINWGLEGNLIGLLPGDYRRITQQSYPGPNKSLEKSNRSHVFHLPSDFIEKNSSPTRPRTVKIYAAFVSTDWVWAVSDFSGLVRMHVLSRNEIWQDHDFIPTSESWTRLFGHFKGGPDWNIERSLATDALDTWRLRILQEQNDYMQRLQKKGPESQYPIESYFQNRDTPNLRPTHDLSGIVCRRPPMRRMIYEICTNESGAFSGFGRHMANDMLFHAGEFPGVPASVICMDNDRYGRFRSKIQDYMGRLESEEFYSTIVSPNSNNPFVFNEKSNTIYVNKFIDVFRRTYARVPHGLYMWYRNAGLLDPQHTIGDDYTVKDDPSLTGKVPKYHLVPVWYYSKIRVYTIIRAKPPEAWGDLGQPLAVTDDIAALTYITTIGLAQFHEQLLNRVDYSKVEISSRGGRPKLLRTGKPGRPKIETVTKKRLPILQKQQIGRKCLHIVDEDTIFHVDEGFPIAEACIDANWDDNPGDNSPEAFCTNSEQSIIPIVPKASSSSSSLPHLDQKNCLVPSKRKQPESEMAPVLSQQYVRAKKAPRPGKIYRNREEVIHAAKEKIKISVFDPNYNAPAGPGDFDLGVAQVMLKNLKTYAFEKYY